MFAWLHWTLKTSPGHVRSWRGWRHRAQRATRGEDQLEIEHVLQRQFRFVPKIPYCYCLLVFGLRSEVLIFCPSAPGFGRSMYIREVEAVLVKRCTFCLVGFHIDPAFLMDIGSPLTTAKYFCFSVMLAHWITGCSNVRCELMITDVREE
jgi:hypothetical protein